MLIGRSRRLPGLVAAICLPLLTTAGGGRAAEPVKKFPRVPPTEPARAVETFRLHPGFRLDSIAAEPLVEDPVALEYDENGLAWVVEMRDYPYTDRSSDKPFVERTTDQALGRVRVLEDTDGDGTLDRSDVFAEDLSWPTGLALWKGGVFVTATPDLWYLKDTDGDRRADVRRKVFTGFRKFNVQAVINNPRWGLDHGLYVAGSSNGGSLRPGDRPDAVPLMLGAQDFRLDPRDESLEIVAGGARFGNAVDDWGERFLCNIRNPVQHVVAPLRYLARNPHLVARSPVWDVAKSGDTLAVFRVSPPEPWREFRARRWAIEANQAYPKSETSGAGYFTSASGVTVYRGDAYPEEFRGQVFVGEVAGNLVHRQSLTAAGVTYFAERADANREFLASTDNWFRPVNFTNAPDGTLHIVDMYRETIEHPWSIPDDIKAELDLESGRDRGRLYRLAPIGFKIPPRPTLGSATSVELVALLESPNGWHRDTAHRLLFERQDAAAIEPLQSLLRRGRDPRARLHALWSLHGLSALEDADALAAMADPAGPVRAHAIQLAEPRLKASAELLARVCELADDAEIRVRFQAAFTLGEATGPASEAALARILVRDAEDQWLRMAAISSTAGRQIVLIKAIFAARTSQGALSDAAAAVLELAATVGAENRPERVAELLGFLAETMPGDEDRTSLHNSCLLGLGDGLARAGDRLAEYAKGEQAPQRWLAAALEQAAATALAAGASEEIRARATRLLGHAEYDQARDPLMALLAAHEPRGVQFAALQALAAFPKAEVATVLIERFPRLTPALRGEAVLALLAREDRLAAFLQAVRDGNVPASQTPPARRNALLKHANAAIRQAAEKTFGAEAPQPRAEIVARYRPALDLAADRDHGLVVYRRECRACHRFRDEGHDVGPNLATIQHRTPEELLLHVLDPNREVGPQFLVYAANLIDGRSTMGMVADESSASLTLKRAENVHEVLLRQQIDELEGTGLSLMPEGFEKTIAPQDLADLIALLRERTVP